MSEHTPTPWKRDGQFIRSEPAWSRGIVADFPLPQQGGLFDAVANIELAVRAVNAHDALLEAATAVLGLGVVPTTQPEYRMLEAAIHLAKGNQP